MLFFKKHQTPNISGSIEKINKKLPNELLVDIFDSITTEAFWNNFYPFYMRDNIFEENEGEQIKEYNIMTTKTIQEPFKKWSKCVKNWLSSSAIVFILERETFKKIHIQQMVIQGFLKRIREQKRRLNKKLLLLTIQQQNEEILSLKASVRNLKLINKKQAIQIKNLELINKKQQIQIKNLELINKKQQIQIKNLELINKKQQIQIKELLKKSKLHESLLLKDRFADLEFKRQQFETKFSEVRKEHKEDTKNYYNKLFSRPQIKNKFKKVRQLSRKDNRSKCPVHKENNNNTTKLKNQIDSKTECCSTSEFLDSSPFEFSNEEKKDYQNKGISSSRKKKSLFSKLFL